MSSAPIHSPEWTCRPSGVYITLDRRSTYSLQTQSSKKRSPAQNERAFSHLLSYRFPLLVHKKCLHTSLGWRFRTGAPTFLPMRPIGGVDTCTHHIRQQELWMAASIYTFLDQEWDMAPKM